MKDTLPKSHHVQNFMLPSEPPQNTPRMTLATLIGFFALVIMDGLVIKHFALDLGEALILLLLAVTSTIWGCCAAISYRVGGSR